MTDAERGFMAAILADPADDTHRLVYADWLEEHGGEPERAEFIRTQVTLRPQGDPHYPGSIYTYSQHRNIDKRLGWFADVNRLLSRAGNGEYGQPNFGYYSWNEQADKSVFMEKAGGKADGARFVIRRGFVHEVRLTTAAFLGGACQVCGGDEADGPVTTRDCPACGGEGHTPGLAKELFERHPIERVVLTDMTPSYAKIGWYELFTGGRDDGLYQVFRREVFGGEITYQLSAEGVLDWVSSKCVAYGRGQVRPQSPGE